MEPRNGIDVEFHSRETAVVVLRGEHDLHSLDQLSLALTLVGGCGFIVADVVEATFVDSSTINAILQAARLARGRGGALELVVGASGAVRCALDAAGISLLQPFHGSRASALANLEAAALLARDEASLHTVAAQIHDLEADTATVRAYLDAERAGVIIRAQVSDASETATPPRRAA